MNIRKFNSEILDRIYPCDLYCACCGKIIDWSRTYHLCDDCFKGMKWNTGRTCSKCGKKLSDANPGSVCFNCREHRHTFDHGYSCTEYGMHERALVFALKYDERTDIANIIGEIMTDRMQAEFPGRELIEKYDIIVPVPITRHKKLSRGYNQARLIAQAFSNGTGVRYDGEILERIKETTAMKMLDPISRRRNISGSFTLIDWKVGIVRGARCLVLDDIYTTGATVDEIAAVLKNAGAEEVDFLSFAAGADVIKS